MGIFKKLNPLKERASGFTFQPRKKGLIQEGVALLGKNPDITDADLGASLGLTKLNQVYGEAYGNEVIAEARRLYKKEQLLNKPAPSSSPAQDQAQGQHGTGLQAGPSQLVNYSPEDLVKQVHESLSRIDFGATKAARFMDNYSDIWALVGPIILLAGTIGEVFLVLWLRQKAQDILAGMSIVAVALVLEGTFLAISYRAAMIRSRMNKKPPELARVDRQKLYVHLAFWCALALGVCATQVIFIAAQTKDDGIGTYGVWTFAILRSVFTLVADAYTAFAHEEGPTTADLALQEQQEREKSATAFLQQKRREVTIINEGILDVKEATTEAEIKEEEQRTRLKIKQLENEAHIDMMRQNHAQNALFTNLQNNVMRAFFDPTVPLEDRERVLNLMGGLMNASHHLSPPKQGETVITPDEEV